MPQLTSNFIFKSKQPNFERDSFKTMEEMAEVQSGWLDEGHISYCEDTQKHYVFRTIDSNKNQVSIGSRWTELFSEGNLSHYFVNDTQDIFVKNFSELSDGLAGANAEYEGATIPFGKLVYVQDRNQFYYNAYNKGTKTGIQYTDYLEGKTGWFHPLMSEDIKQQVDNILVNYGYCGVNENEDGTNSIESKFSTLLTADTLDTKLASSTYLQTNYIDTNALTSTLNTKLADYLKKDALDTKLADYLKKDALDTKLADSTYLQTNYIGTNVLDTKLASSTYLQTNYIGTNVLDTKLASSTYLRDNYVTIGSLDLKLADSTYLKTNYIGSDSLDTKLENSAYLKENYLGTDQLTAQFATKDELGLNKVTSEEKPYECIVDWVSEQIAEKHATEPEPILINSGFEYNKETDTYTLNNIEMDLTTAIQTYNAGQFNMCTPVNMYTCNSKILTIIPHPYLGSDLGIHFPLSFRGAFLKCTNLKYLKFFPSSGVESTPWGEKKSKVEIQCTDMYHMFCHCKQLETVEDILNISQITTSGNMAKAFYIGLNGVGKLKTIWLKGLAYNISFEQQPELDTNCVLYMIQNALAQDKRSKSIGIYLHETVYNKCKDDESIIEALAEANPDDTKYKIYISNDYYEVSKPTE